MTATNRYLLPFTAIGLADVSRVGGKNANLGELTRAGLRVPPGHALTADAFRDFLARVPLVSTLVAQLSELDPNDLVALGRASDELQKLVLDAPLPPDITEAVREAYADLERAGGGTGAPVAVRSSATAEDGAEASFAGVQDTYLWIRGADAVLDCVRRCWASYFSPEALSYRRHAGIDAAHGGMSVTLQQMVDARVAGVMFTVNPASGDPSTVAIDAAWGLGVSVVSGDVTPDHYVYNRVERRLLHEQVATKLIECVPDEGQGTVVTRQLPPERQSVACLSADDVSRLAELAELVEAHYGCHQDIEWAMDRNATAPDDLFLLQSRPETVWSRRPRPSSGNAPKSALDLVAGLLSGG
jgi:pyruvate,water dikinase